MLVPYIVRRALPLVMSQPGARDAAVSDRYV